jgi:hypothetical protein
VNLPRSALTLSWLAAAPFAFAGSPEERALAFLAREVPAWYAENACYSCHNNGDGARSLFVARRLGWRVPDEALRDTLEWLSAPSGWENNRGDPRFSDKQLARLQFAAALVEATDGRLVQDRAARLDAASLVARDQHPDGSWQIDSGTSAGSPITYGPALATSIAVDVLRRSDPVRFKVQIARANEWLLKLPLRFVPEAAGVLLAVEDRRSECVEFLRRAQTGDGGWGPAIHSPAEPFDTALALLALASASDEKLISRGRAWLIQNQLPTGGWPETTRPPGGQSYAQHISTTAWATLALVRTASRP